MITAFYKIDLPFRTNIREGDEYKPIKIDFDGCSATIHPFVRNSAAKVEIGYVNTFRKIEIELSMDLEWDTTKKDEIRKMAAEKLDYALNIFLLHYKTKSGQFWIHPINLNDVSVNSFNFEVEFRNDANEIVDKIRGIAGGLFIVGIGLNNEIWEKIESDMAKDISPSIVDYHVEQARTGIFSHDERAVIMGASVAIEIFTKRFCWELAKSHGKLADPAFKKYSTDNQFVVNYIGKLIPHLTGKNLKVLNMVLYNEIDFLFRARNKIAHEGSCEYKDDAGFLNRVDHDRAKVFFLKMNEYFQFLYSIEPMIASELKSFFQDR